MMGAYTKALQNRWLYSSAAIICVAAASPAMAQTRSFDIPAQDASRGIPAFAKQAGIQLLANARDVRGKRTNAVRGNYSVEEALRILLKGTGLEAGPDGGTGIISIRPRLNSVAASPGAREAVPASATADSESTDIVVTGTHIRGAAPAGSPLKAYDRKTIDQSGASTVAEFAQTMTENFGVTTPTAFAFGNNSVGFNQTSGNDFSGSAFNLHGLGSGATLTLINGQRLSSGGSDSSFIDVSTIPLSAVDRIDVMSDGGSAIYGADAVAGVVNILLKKDYDGAESSVRYSDPTRSGGGQETTLSQLLGKSWRTGNVMAVVEYGKQDAITDRDFFTRFLFPGYVVPANKHINVLISGNQTLFDDRTTLSGSFSYSKRNNNMLFGESDFNESIDTTVKQYNGNLGISHEFNGGWSAAINGTLSNSDSSFLDQSVQQDYYYAFTAATKLREVSLQTDGPLFSLGAGDVRAAMGGGFRSESILRSDKTSKLSRNISYLYGELLVPLIAPDEAVTFINRLEVSIAGRYDHYNDFGSSNNLKAGLTWSPAKGVSFRGSYSTSFRPPLLTQLVSQQNFIYTQYQANANSPTGKTDTLVVGAGQDGNLLPEKAKSYSFGMDIKPSAIPNFTISLTYFRTDFKNRISTPPFSGNPFSGTSNIFSQPSLSPFITLSPSPAAVAAYFADPGFYSDRAGAGQAGVQAIFDDRLVNIAQSIQRGLDGSVDYNTRTGLGTFDISGSGTYYIENKYLAVPGGGAVNLINLLGQPLRFRARGGLSWSNGGWNSSLFVNYANGYENPLFTPARHIAALTTVDMQITYRFADKLGYTGRSGTKISLTVQNLFDRDPPRVSIPSGQSSPSNFDAINASPFGRVIAVQLTKTW